MILILVTTFAKLSNDLKALSVPDISVLALAFELIKNNKEDHFLRSEPLNLDMVKRDIFTTGEEKSGQHKQVKEVDEDGFEVVKSKKKQKVEDEDLFWNDNDEGEWIGLDNLNQKINGRTETMKIENINENTNIVKPNNIDNNISQIKDVYLTTADFTVQNVALKMGIPILSIDGLRIKRIRNYLLKCYSCYFLNWETSRDFCENCGYNTLMKIGYSVDSLGKVKVFDKDPDPRVRGVQVINYL
jgi:RNA-binding protein NOB1